MKLKRIILITSITMMLIITNLIPVIATSNPTTTNSDSVPKTLTKEYNFTTDTKPFKYDAPKTITENSYTYESKNITYKETNHTEPIKRTKTYTGLTSKSVPNSITENGKTLYLNGANYTSKTTPAKKSTQNVTETKTYNNVVPGQESNVIKTSIQKDGITLKKSSQNYTTSTVSFSENASLASYDYDYNVGGTSIQLTDGSPKQGDWQNDIRNYFELPSTTSITDAYWRGDIQHKSGTNKYTRSITYSGQRIVYNYTVKYAGTKTVISENEKTTYDATAEYVSKDKASYSVTATVTYEMTADSITTLEQKEKEEQEKLEEEQKIEEEKAQEYEDELNKFEQEQQEQEEKRLAQKKRNRNILIGGLAVLAILGTLIGFLIANKRKDKKPNTPMDELDELFAQAATIQTSSDIARKETEKDRAIQQKKEEEQRQKEEKARKAAEEKEKRRLEKEKAYENKKAENAKRKEKSNKSPFMKKLDQIKEDLAGDDE